VRISAVIVASVIAAFLGLLYLMLVPGHDDRYQQQKGNVSATPTHKVTSKKPHKTNRSSLKPSADNDDGESNIKPELQRKLRRVVLLYASWPGSIPRQTLAKQLRDEEPFITDDAVKKIEAEWGPLPLTFRVNPQGVVSISDLHLLPQQPDKGTAEVFVMLHKHFMPVGGKPDDQTAVQTYSVTLQVINQEWHVISIAPQSGNSSNSPSS
jgi:hypothetical protein